ncbi:SusD/RagB family nutrient-binding outer membrane lipoprotein [Elizabethkingia meningoseptica]|uniref:SusD/RagB family nutrient-binding outer membrane lipoprotein n=1 Tax=Elizabethkingia meningoseptica TaxID=238 RepID=UPI00301A2C1D
MKLTKISIAAFCALLSMASCNNYMDINSNPNNASESGVGAPSIFPGAVSNTFRVHARDLVNLGSLYTNFLGTNSALYGNGNDIEFTMNLNNTYYAQLWDNTYRGVNNLQQVINKANENPDFIYYGAMAKVMKVFYMQPIVDLYGNSPYSDAFKQQQNTTPKYDKDSDIYKTMFAELDQAITALNTPAGGTTSLPTNQDIVFKGDLKKWVGFANAVKLRMIIRMSNVTGEMATVRDQQIASLVGKEIIGQDVLVNPGYSAGNDDSQNPFASFFFSTSAGSQAQAIRMDTASGHLAICLNGNDKNDTNAFYQKFNGVVDGRKSRMFTVSAGRVIGVKQGARPGEPDMTTERPISQFGAGWFTTQPEVDAANASSRAGALMTATEINLLKAEASLRYPSLGYDGKSAFENAITSSFAYLGATGASDYIAKVNTVNKLGWTGSNTDKTEAIMTQKWLALGMITPIQVFFDYNRTGYPYTPLATTAVYDKKPYRLMYPTSEIAANSQNVPALTAAQCFAKNELTPFWLK